ncbi:MAG: hypothetical protein KY438_05020 [Actinobacteria bacterium]|nr:hypothetical protein [Actinomycetota bacterium]
MPERHAMMFGVPFHLDRRPAMTMRRRTAAGLVALLFLSGVTAGCGDDPGEDEIGDGEVIDEGD